MQTEEQPAQGDCPHTHQERIIDRLGMMTEKRDGKVTAPVLEWHVQCTACGTTLLASYEAQVAELPDKVTVDKVAWALGADEGAAREQVRRPGQRDTLWTLIQRNWRRAHER